MATNGHSGDYSQKSLEDGLHYFSTVVEIDVIDPVDHSQLKNTRTEHKYSYEGKTYFFATEKIFIYSEMPQKITSMQKEASNVSQNVISILALWFKTQTSRNHNSFLAAGLVSALLAVSIDIGDKMARELKSYGANILIEPASRAIYPRM